jgi:hypothetical protein
VLVYVHLEFAFRVSLHKVFLKCGRGSHPLIFLAVCMFFLPLLRAEVMFFFATVQNFAHKKTNGLDECILGIILIAVEYWIYFSIWSNFV